MQSSALLGRARQPRSSGHLCWRYGGQDEFAARALEFLTEGLAEGQRVLIVGGGGLDDLARELRTRTEFDERGDRAAVQVASLEASYPFGTVVEPEQQVRNYAAATEQAVAAGFTGLRVAADATPLVRTPAQLDAFTRYEHLVDRYMSTRPMSAMCAYSTEELDDETITLLSCLHPLTNQRSTPFHLHASPLHGTSVTLDGELDMASQELWARVLARAEPRPVDGSVVIDATGLRFIDHRSLLTLADYADRHGTTVVLRTRVHHPARVLELLGVTGVRVEQVA